MPSENSPRPLEHLVLPVSGLDAARLRLTQLGFTVAPEGLHPFGTANCCVFFSDGTFLEPLDVADLALAERESAAGNVFTRHALEFRSRNGMEGLSALVFGTQNAAGDHEAFIERGLSAGDILNFARDFVTADGLRDRAAFRLAFAASTQAPDCLFFTCERVAVPKGDRSALLSHSNGVTGIARVYMSARDPSALAGFLEGVSGAAAMTIDGGLALQSGSFELLVLTPSALAAQTGLPHDDDPEPRFRAVAFAGADVGALEVELNGAGIDCHNAPAGFVVPSRPGQGAAFIFL
ncbi:MAG: VOC family protein [Rhizobiaceae bacterium]